MEFVKEFTWLDVLGGIVCLGWIFLVEFFKEFLRMVFFGGIVLERMFLWDCPFVR